MKITENLMPFPTRERVPINIDPAVRERLKRLLNHPFFSGTGVGYSAFVNRACQIAEAEIGESEAR